MSTRVCVRATKDLLCSSRVTRHYRNMATVTSTETAEHAVDEKPFTVIPGPKGLPVIGTTFEVLRRAGHLNKLIQERHDKYGPIYKDKIGTRHIVFLRDVNAIEQLLRQDGKYPQGLKIDMWLKYRNDRGLHTGLFLSDGPRWQRLRRVVNKYMMNVKAIDSYTGEFNGVVEEFIDRLAKIRTPDNEILQLDKELFNWALESMSSILFEKRLGCLTDSRSQDTTDFIQSSHDILEQTKKLVFLPPRLAKWLMPGACKKHDEAWDVSVRVAHNTIDERIEEIQSMEHRDDRIGFITNFLQEETLSIKDIYANVSELMGGAVDTTANTSMMALYELSRHPEVQDALYKEVARIVPPDQQPSADHLKEMHYIRAVVKETLRLHPTGAFVIRRLQQDATLLGYRVPKETLIWVDMYSMGRLEKHYTDPDSFRPDRWMRETRTEKPHPFAYLPFGFGARMCIGRRVAELEMYLLLTQLVRRFRIEPVSMEPVTMVTDMLFHAKDPVKIRLHDRSSG